MAFLIPYYGLKRFYEIHKSTIHQLIDEAWADGFFLDSPEIELLEQNLANLCHRKHAVAVSSCTDALFFSLHACGIGKGDEVLLPSFSFIATLSAVLRTEATPVFLDIQYNDYTLLLDEIKQKTTDKTKALIIVPLFGSTQDYSEIEQWCKQQGIRLIEDAAQALGVRIDNRPSGSWGNVSCISFDPSKIAHAFGTGGVILTDDDNVYQCTKRMRYQGKQHNDYVELGFNSRMSTAQAQLLNWQLEHLEQTIEKRQRLATIYFDELKNVPFIQLPLLPSNVKQTFHKFVIKSPYRNLLKEHLQQHGIQTMIHYSSLLFEYSLIQHSTYRADNIHQAKQLTNEVLSLPLYPELTEEEIRTVCKTIKLFKP